MVTVENSPALRVIDAWPVTSADTFPDNEFPLPAYRPALTRAPNGDLLVAFSTSTDSYAGDVRVIRSTDHGRTWSPATIIDAPTPYGPNTGVSATRGMTTLSDGRILLPFNAGINHIEHNNRESLLFVGQSSDNGHHWTHTSKPIDLPVPFREQWIAGSRILELTDGTLLLSIWGTQELVKNWREDPMRQQCGVLRSHDGGNTWSEYSTIGHDPHNPPQFPPFHSVFYPSGANEFTMAELPDGRVLALVRFATGIGAQRGQAYVSWSSDRGMSWSAPLATGLQVETLSLISITGQSDSALVLGYRALDKDGRRPGETGLAISHDGGISWHEEILLRDPIAKDDLEPAVGEPDFYQISDNRLLVLFQSAKRDQPFRIVANLVSVDSSAITASTNQTVYVQRTDRANWPWPLASACLSVSPETPVRDVVSSAAYRLGAQPSEELIFHDIDLATTVQTAGIVNGAVLHLHSRIPRNTNRIRIGHNELDVCPSSRHLYGWDDNVAPGPFALDARGRSLGLEIEIPSGQALDWVELRGNSTATRLQAEHYRLFTSLDNKNFTLVEGWLWSMRVEHGHQSVHRFQNLRVDARYLKINQIFTDNDPTFILDDPRRDITIGFTHARGSQPEDQ